MKAYTYSIYHIPSKRFYYGCRKSTTLDLFESYFTSSKLVKRLIKEDGIESFTIKIRKRFDSYERARLWESKLLLRVGVPSNQLFLNQAISSPRLCIKDSVSEQKRRENISIRMKELWKLSSYRNQFIKPESQHSRHKEKKVKTSRSLGPATIERNGERKEVKRNFVPAYEKCGWKRVGTSAQIRTETTQ